MLKQIAVLIMIMFLTASCDIIKQIQKTDTQGYMLTFVDNETQQIRVRWSKNGNTWKTADFRSVLSKGAGATSDYLGLFRIIPWWTLDQKINVIVGEGEYFENHNLYSTSQIALSAPKATYGKDNQWIICYQNSANVLSVRIFDVNEKRFLDMDYAPIENAYNDHVIGAPAIIRMKDKLLLAWNRDHTLRLAYGTISNSGVISWQNKYGIDLPPNINSTDYGNVREGPTLTHDHNRFYLCYIRQTRATLENNNNDYFNNQYLFLHTSDDGINWSAPKVLTSITIGDGNFISIAGNSDGSILIASLGSALNASEFWRYHNGQLTQLNANRILGFVPKPNTSFSLVPVGRPVPEQNP